MKHPWIAIPLLAACAGTAADPTADPTFDPFASADLMDWEAPPPPSITLSGPTFLRIGANNTYTVTGDIAVGERVYLGSTTAGTGRGPCLPVAGGKCLNLKAPVSLAGSAVATTPGSVALTIPTAAGTPSGTNVSVQALIVRSIRGVDSILSAPLTLQALNGPPEGTVLRDWTAFNFADDGYRDGCVGGAEYVKSTGYAGPKYVGVTICDDYSYKIRLSDQLYGTFTSVGDWSGSGEDQCEYVGGEFISFPQPSNAVDPGHACWSRGPAGVEPVYEASCASNRWVPAVHRCTTSIPDTSQSLPAEGTVFSDWTSFDFADDGYRDGCAGGEDYVKSTPWASPAYVGVTLCSDTTYKIRLSDRLYGTFTSVGDWSGSGEDQCEYVGGSFRSFPEPSNAVDPGHACWSRGPAGAQPVYEANCASNRWVPSVHACSAYVPAPPAGYPNEGDLLSTWTQVDFYDDGYRDGCAGGDKYIKSTPWSTAAYVGVTLCDHATYKIWISDAIYGTFHSAGDWSGSGEDHCEYVGGTFGSFPQGAFAVDPGKACWSRGPAGVEPVFEASCASNRWVPEAYSCNVLVP